MNKLTNKALKKLLEKIENELNAHEEWEEEYWTYKLELKKNNIICKIYDGEECREDWLEYTFEISNDYTEYNFVKDVNFDTTTIIKSLINTVYENELNYRNKFVKGYNSFCKRKIKSLELWDSRNNTDRCKKIQNELIIRYRATKEIEFEISKLKDIVKDLYNCLTILVPTWRLEDIKDRVIKKCQEFNIKNVSINYIDDTLYIIKKDVDKFDIKINGYCNINAIVEQIIQRVGKVA